jgi:hypothetical protein
MVNPLISPFLVVFKCSDSRHSFIHSFRDVSRRNAVFRE